MAAEIKEVVGWPYSDTQNVLPDSTELLFQGVTWPGHGACEFKAFRRRRGKCFAVDLPIRRQRQCVHDDEVRRRHVFGQFRSNPGPQLAVRRGVATRLDDKTHEPRIARIIFAQDYDDLTYAGILGQYGFNLAQLYSKSAQLDLMVNAAEKFDRTVGAIPGKVPSSIEARGRIMGKTIGQELFGR